MEGIVKSVLYTLAIIVAFVGAFFEFFEIERRGPLRVKRKDKLNTITGTCSLLFGLLLFLASLL